MKMDEQKRKLNVLFVCTGNSCRSQMAEGWARHLKGDVIEAFSAGVYPTPVSRRAAQVMMEAGVDISWQKPKHVEDLCGIEFDYVVTLCDNAARECPAFGGRTKVIHRPFADPGYMIGSEEAMLDAHRRTRDLLRKYVETMPQSLEEQK
jgi:arsenate reductase (thioredoxin)